MITCELKGGLGNQLFQIFAVIAYSLENKTAFKFLYSDAIPSITPRHSYWNSFLKSMKFFTVSELPGRCLRVPARPEFHYTALPTYESLRHEHVCLNGYFQSHKYFHHRQHDIFRLIQLSQQKKACREKYGIGDTKDTISMHFRLGDYKHLSHAHPIMSVDYYINALTHVLSKSIVQTYKVIYFCEEEDNETVRREFIDPISCVFPSLVFEKANDNMEDWEQMLLMSCCTHNVIANSSFSWFGAYFNEAAKNHMVCYPHVWFAGSAADDNDTKDMFPEKWTKIHF